MFRSMLALDEIVTNLMRYGYPHADGLADRQQIVVRRSADQDDVTAVVEDTGVPFDPLNVPPPDLDAIFEGMHRVRSVAKSAEYSREGDRNVLRVTVGTSPWAQ
jgi:anti-sigma regulatory factor (Ser/Thr protein kinase)